MLRLRVGQTLTSTADTTTVIVIKAGTGYEFVTCGGVAMVSEPTTAAGPTAVPLPGHTTGTELGRRYETADGTVELLCTKAGTGSLAVNDVPMTIKAAKALPASD
jgi:hypothetical protein